MLIGIWEKLEMYRPNRRISTILLLTFGLLVSWAIDYLFMYLLTLFSIGAGYMMYRFFVGKRAKRQHARDKATATTPAVDDTTEFEPIDQDGLTRPTKPRELIIDGAGRTWLVINKTETIRPSILRRAEHVTTRSKIELFPSEVLDPDLVLRSSFEPIKGETQLYVYDRFHWMSHGPREIGIALMWLLATILVIVFSPLDVSQSALLCLALLGLFGFFYLKGWIPWAFTYYAVSDSLVMRSYKAPLWLEGNPTESVATDDIKTVRHLDQAGFTNMVLGWFGLTEFGILKADTNAEHGDEWLNQGMSYVRHPQKVQRIIDEHRMARRRNSEEMERRRTDALEELVRRERVSGPDE